MRHKLKGNKLSMNTAHRNSLLKNLSSALILNESINTTLPKAKELKRYAEKKVVADISELGDFDAIIITDLGDPQSSYEHMLQHFPADRVFSPGILNISSTDHVLRINK